MRKIFTIANLKEIKAVVKDLFFAFVIFAKMICFFDAQHQYKYFLSPKPCL
ncbi:MAG: hypothetical protein IJB10_04045 [Clostridia bacterium]|nr:hypothetical protein [Clostridia bacterium]